MKEQGINPIFIIYCAAAGGRVDSDIVAGILKNFQEKAIPICYVITNIYGASAEQLQGQIDGGRYIMDAIFGPVSVSTGKLCYHYGHSLDSSDNGSPSKQGILVGVNSRDFSNIMGTMPILNIHELMDFLANNLNDEDFCKFVALTMSNRDFWDRVSDAVRSRVQKASDTMSKWKLKTISFFKRLFGLEKFS
ncbi:unnamed protein product [Rotaria magnacalcarata]